MFTLAAISVKAPLNGLKDGQAAPSADAAVPDLVGASDAVNGAVSALGQTDALFSWGSYFQALAVLCLIIAVLFATLWFLRRRGGLKVLTRQGDLSLESRIPLGPKKFLVVVRFLNKRVLLGVTDQQITMLTELPTDEYHTAHLASPEANGADFMAHLTDASENRSEASG